MTDSHTSSSQRLDALRMEMARRGLDAYLVPMADLYLNDEYLAPEDQRVKFLTGFSGTAGMVLVTKDKAGFFTDSRYTLQAQKEVSAALFELVDVATQLPRQWLAQQLATGSKIGFDPKLHRTKQIESLKSFLLEHDIRLLPVEENLIDVIWADRPTPAAQPFFLHDVAYAGESAADKCARLATQLREKKLDAALISQPSCVAWLLNLRGHDIPYTPLPCAMAILHADARVQLFTDLQKITPQIRAALGESISYHAIGTLTDELKALGAKKARVLVSEQETSFALLSALHSTEAQLVLDKDICVLPRALKNKTEVEGMRAAHRRDGAAVVQFLAWLDGQENPESLSELDVDAKLTALRAQKDLFQGLSFGTIAAAGPNAAIVHYTAKPDSFSMLVRDNFLLLDSGGQYLDGTTDITRTIVIGTPSAEMKDRFTRVLKGHIALASLTFPKGTSGSEIDVLARHPLWEIGLDYGHGTGHGVGSFSKVHEGPHSISRRDTTPLEAGMVTSNEPGFYKADHYGIRHENMMVVVPCPDLSLENTPMFKFEPLTLVPFDRRGIKLELLCDKEKTWLNAYHAYVREQLTPLLDEKTAAWLAAATAPL